MVRKDLSRTYVCCTRMSRFLEVDVNEMIRREPSVDLTDMQVEFSCNKPLHGRSLSAKRPGISYSARLDIPKLDASQASMTSRHGVQLITTSALKLYKRPRNGFI